MELFKMQVAGNDYLFVDLRIQKDTDRDWRLLAGELSDRHFGLGADGLVLLRPSEQAACKMEFYNADGSTGKMCGTALACIGRYLKERMQEAEEEWAPDAKKPDAVQRGYRIETAGGLRSVEIFPEEDWKARIWMGNPTVWKRPCVVYAGRRIPAYRVQVGNPHLVLFASGLGDAELNRFGPGLSCHPVFPDGCNVEFVRLLGRSRMQVLVWERGSGRTLACGTGATAAFAAARALKLVPPDMNVEMPGGMLQASERDGAFWLESHPKEIFFGKLEIGACNSKNPVL